MKTACHTDGVALADSHFHCPSSTISLFFDMLKAEVMAERLFCCLRWRYSAFDRNSGRERLLESSQVQLDTTRMG